MKKSAFQRKIVHLFRHRTLYIVAGCNGAGKTTAFRTLLGKQLGNPDYLNADDVAYALRPEDPYSVRFQAGRVNSESFEVHLRGHKSFCIETTLSGNARHNLAERAHEHGFRVELFFFWLPNADQAVARVQQRVQEGGHFVPERDVRRRYIAGIDNLVNVYIPVVDKWHIYDNSLGLATVLASGGPTSSSEISFEQLVGMTHSFRIDRYNTAYASELKYFVKKLLAEKAEKDQNVVYSFDGQIVTLSGRDARWLYNEFHHGLRSWEYAYLTNAASQGADMVYNFDNQRITVPASLVLQWVKELGAAPRTIY
ncbi:MAG: zeta toxin family protein [Bacteroidaceae bacterium]|nr:zeta toxin family protein [Bacteroidaceae bacterium]